MQLSRIACATLSSLLFAGLLAAPALAARPDDPGMIKFRGTAFPIAEEAGEVVLVVKRLRGDTGEVSVDIALAPGTALVGEDYEDAATTLVWADGDRSDKTFTVTILDDEEEEGQETFAAFLSNPTGGAEIAPPTTATIRIKPSDQQGGDGNGDDDDDNAGVIKVARAKAVGYESIGSVGIEVQRRGGELGMVTVDYVAMAGSAEEGSDFAPSFGTLEWADGDEASQIVDIEILDDAEAEPTETFTFLLSNPTGGAKLAGRNSTQVSIVDDDDAAASAACLADETTLCLRDGRYEVEGEWARASGETGEIRWEPVTDDSGIAWFFRDSNLELLLKVLDGCPVNQRTWAFLSATTTVAFELRVTDLEDGSTKTYRNDLGSVAKPVLDTSAFANCP